MPETMRVPWNTRGLKMQILFYCAVLGLLVVAASRLGEWNEAAWVVVAGALLLFHRGWRLYTIPSRAEHCLVLGQDALTINCLDTPAIVPWAAMHSCETAAVGTIMRSDSLLLLLYEDRLPREMDQTLARPFPREPGTRSLRIDCLFPDMNGGALKAEIERRIAAARMERTQ